MRASALAVIFGVITALTQTPPAKAGPSLLMEPQTGLVLYAEDADQPWRPASLTKLMTAYVTFEAIRDGRLSPEDTITCSQHAFEQVPSRLGAPVGSQIKVDLAIKALIVKSANDVAVMLAEKIGGSEAGFVEMMNSTAKRLGMTNTTFVNANGLPIVGPDGKEEGAYSVTSARDMAILASMLLKEFPQYTELFGLPFVKVGNHLLMSHNSLLRTYEGADGMKTGFICAAGYNLVASATRNGKKLVAVVLGEKSGGARATRAAALFEHGFAIYPWKAVLAPTLATFPVETTAGAVAPDLHSVVCNAAALRRMRRPALKPGHRKAGAPAKGAKGKRRRAAEQPAMPAAKQSSAHG